MSARKICTAPSGMYLLEVTAAHHATDSTYTLYEARATTGNLARTYASLDEARLRFPRTLDAVRTISTGRTESPVRAVNSRLTPGLSPMILSAL
jgi:hypothetical protein